MKRAVYAGSFDPPTKGHLWIIEQASRLFDQVIVAIGINAAKQTMFSAEQRQQMLVEATAHLSNVWIDSFEDEYLVRFAARVGAQVLIRGIRNSTDFEYEKVMCAVNHDIAPALLEVFLIPPRELAEVSSSTVKALIGPAGWEKIVCSLVPQSVLYRLMQQRCSLWRNLVSAGACGDEDEFWKTVLLPYFEPSRHYHTWEHFAQVMREFERIKDRRLRDPLAVQFALALHDSVYDPHRKDNEEQSAQRARSLALAIGMPEAFGQRVFDLVMVTAHQQVPTDRDARLLCDIDLSILGAPVAEFEAYDRAIQKEYAWIEKETFRSRRRAILWGLLLRQEWGTLFLTPEFIGRYESQAKKNLEHAYARLEG